MTQLLLADDGKTITANRLVASAELGGDTTTYEWDAVGRLITTTVGSNVSRVYAYDQRNNLTSALVDGLLTTFVYDGDGHRRQMSVAGEVTTYTLDYAGGFRVLLEQGGAFAETKHYLYGMECIAELVDADEPASEWRYYHQDGNHLVRQTTNKAATVTLAWTYSPEGAVVLGEEGPVTHLGCEATYDWSTGLIFKSGTYFDPNTGIWITMGGLVVWNNWQPNPQRNRQQRRRRWLWLALLLLILLLTLAGCGGGGTPTPIAMNPTATCTPTATPNPTLPPAIISTIGAPPTFTPIPTMTPQPLPLPPTQTPLPPTMTPYPGVPIPTVSIFPNDTTSLVENRGFSLEHHPGIDLVPTSKRGAGNDAADYKVIALHGGYAYNNRPNLGIGLHTISVTSLDHRYEIGYSHVEPTPTLAGAEGKPISAGDEIGTLVPYEEDLTTGDMAHLHLSLKVPPGRGNDRDPSFLITNWGEPLRWSP